MSLTSDSRTSHLLAWEASPYSAVSTSESDDGSLPNPEEPRFRRPTKLRKALPFLIHFVLISAYSAVYLLSWKHNRTVGSLGIPYEQKIFEVSTSLNKSTARFYAGEPSEELETSWHMLLQSKSFVFRNEAFAYA